MIKRGIYILLIGTLASLCGAESQVRPAADIQDNDIAWIKKVADWQLTQTRWNQGNNWEHGALFTGMMAAYETTKDETYLEATRAWAGKYNWQLHSDNTRHADYHCCAQAYLELYFLDEDDPNRISHAIENNDRIVNDPYHFYCDSRSSSVWSWCDALYMHPPVLARLSRALSDSSYTELMHQMWSETQACLYDTEAGLFYRDISYFDDREGGEKVFWARGNGWVMGGLVRMLQYLPLDDPYREGYITTFQQMGASLAQLQLSDGYWYSNLLYPEHYNMPETSGTGFFCYGLAWGINQGLLEAETYQPVAEAAWIALQNAAQEDGFLGYVQQPGAGPNTSPADSTHVYGVGAYLLAGSEMYKLHQSQDPSHLESFETYVTTDSDTPNLTETWRDGLTNNSQAIVELGNYGNRFMTLYYGQDEADQFAQADRVFNEPQDWLAQDDVALSLSILGDSNNDPLPLRFIVTDAQGQSNSVTCTDPNLLLSDTWQQWAVTWSELETVDLTQVTGLSLRIGPGIGSGSIRVDDLNLIGYDYHSTDERDLNQDGLVDLFDFAQLAACWNQTYAEILTPTVPDESQVTAYWELDQASGVVAVDSSGQGHHGIAVNTDWLTSGGYQAGAALFNGSTDSDCHIQFSTDAINLTSGTVSLWAYLDAEQDGPEIRYFVGHTTLPAYGDRLQLYMDNGDTELDLGLGDTHALHTGVATLTTECWTHIALTWDGSNYQVFIDGLLTAEGTYDGLDALQSIAHLGNNGSSGANQGFNGLLDEVRFYAEPLSDTEVLYLADAGTQVVIDDPAPEDLNLDGTINALDLQDWTSAWLTQST